MTTKLQVSPGQFLFSILLVGLAGCALQSTQPVEPSLPPLITSTTDTPEPMLPSGWQTYTHRGQCGYAIGHPSSMDATSQGSYNVLLSPAAADPGGPLPNFIYISVIPDDLESNEPGMIYNYDPAETAALLSLQAGESRSLRDDPTFVPWFTYTRLPDKVLNGQTAQTYENTQPWEFPPGTKEIRYYLKVNGCTYLIGGYLATVGSGQPEAIGEELFDQIIATFRPAL